MDTKDLVNVSRDCEAIQVPSGIKVTLPQGTQVRITQSLGGSYTVLTELGYMLRIDEQDADAIGKKPTVPAESKEAVREADTTPEAVEKRVWEELKLCYDPEIPVNIVDLGLIYECKVEPLPEGGYQVKIKMTLTAPGCGMGEVIKHDAAHRASTVPGVKKVDAELVWDPPWSSARMSEAAKLKLGIM